MLQTLRRVGDSLVVTVPKDLIEQYHLKEGSQVELSLEGHRMTIAMPTRRHYILEDLLAEMHAGSLPKIEGWDETPPVGGDVI